MDDPSRFSRPQQSCIGSEVRDSSRGGNNDGASSGVEDLILKTGITVRRCFGDRNQLISAFERNRRTHFDPERDRQTHVGISYD